MGGHSSRRRIAPPLKQPTRATSGNTLICRPYSVLLPVGFAVPPPLPAARCALTAPFHPCRGKRNTPRRSVLCGTVPEPIPDCAGTDPPDVIRHRLSVEPGLSSP